MHFIGPAEKIKTLKLDAKIVLKNNQTHIFSNTELPSSINEFVRCSKCELCQPTKQPIKHKYVVYPPLILLPTNTQISDEDAQQILEQFSQCTHVAINEIIKENDIVRRPQIKPVIGDFGQYYTEFNLENASKTFWASSVQNQITQMWAPMYTMFSRGNITEKRRVLTDFSKQNKIKKSTVIDLYAGIGYFTFSYAKQEPGVVYCWEINPWSVHGMVRAAKVNKFNIRVIHENEDFEPLDSDQIVVFLETNLKAPKRLERLNLNNVSHINMGLLPDAHDSFDTALELAKYSERAVFHVHENVRLQVLDQWVDDTSKVFGECLHVEKIKMYSPGVAHICGDFRRRSVCRT